MRGPPAGDPALPAGVVGQLAVIDCAVTPAALTAQLAAALVRAEQPALAAHQGGFAADVVTLTHAQARLCAVVLI